MRTLAFMVVTWSVAVGMVQAQDSVGGHFGLALPLVTHARGQNTTISDDTVFVFPTGITVHRSETFAFDLEFAPAVHQNPRSIDLTLHPGLLWGLGNGWSAGGRMAFGIGSATLGFTPLLNKGLIDVGRGATVFGEFDLPIRFKQDASGKDFTSVGIAVVFGIGF
jgi:hypothetical protein